MMILASQPPARSSAKRLARASGRSLTCLGAVALLAGCVLNPDVPKPATIAPAHFRADSSPGNHNVWPAPAWWQNFGSPELDRLEKQAVASNYDIAAAVARLAQAEHQIAVARAPLFPSLDAKFSATHSYQNGASRSSTVSLPNGTGGTTSQTISAGGASSNNEYEPTLSASYALDIFGKNRSNLKSAEQSALASRYDAAAVALSTESSVASTYFTIVSTQERLKIAQANLKTARQLLAALQAELQVGVTNALDVTRQETQVANQLAAIPPLRQSLDQNIDALAVLVGEPPADLSVSIANLSDLKVPSISVGLPSTLLLRRPDIAEARAQLIAARYDVSAAKAALFPSFNLTAEGGWRKAALSGLISPINEFYTLAGDIGQPIFEGGELRGQLAVSRARYAELLADYQSSVINGFEDVDNALVDVRETAAQEKRQAQSVVLAQRALTISKAQLRAGITDVTTLLDSEQTLFTARDTLAQTQESQLAAAVSLYQALGGGWNLNIANKTPVSLPSYTR